MTELKQWDYVNDVIRAESVKDSDELYTKWASKYDDDASGLNYMGNESLVKYSFDLIKNDESSIMLDIAAGTGNTAMCFKNAGFKGLMDAIEINAAMLEVAKQKKLYRKAICKGVSVDEPLPVPANTYDFAAIGGALHGNHIPQECIPRIVDTLKIGGLLIFNSRNTEKNLEYQSVLWKILNGLVADNKIALVKNEVVPYFQENCRESGELMTAQLSVYRRLK